MEKVKIIECPRDAMQGIPEFISTDKKVAYMNQLLKVGYKTLDFGSFVSPKAIPQMRDTASVLNRMKLDETLTELSAVVVNLRGAENACNFDEIRYLGYPFSISETFQQRNTKKSINESFELMLQLQNLCEVNAKTLIVYVSMAFGNPYGDFYDTAVLSHWVDRLVEEKIEIINISDTVGVATPKQIGDVFAELLEDFPKTELGIHLHTRPDNWQEKVAAAYEAGCRRFDSAIKGFGGCPMAKDELVGNLATENLIAFLEEKKAVHDLDLEEFDLALKASAEVFV